MLEEIKISSVPPHISDVVTSNEDNVTCVYGSATSMAHVKANVTFMLGLFWRYDMDSYAANSKNEDRSQHILDRIPRVANERHVTTPVFFCACYDGHGGEEAVDFVQKQLYDNIKKHLTDGSTTTVREAITKGFAATDSDFTRRSRIQFEKGMWSSCSVGACAVIALVVDKRLYVASCGDCRAIMAFREPDDGSLSVQQITLDHSANETCEQERLRGLHPDDYDIVREVGARNFYVKGRLQPTRSIGDTYMKCKDVNRAPMPRGLRVHGSFRQPNITAVPDVFEVDLEDRQPEFLVLGSDGLYGELSNEEIADMVAEFRASDVENVSLALRTSVLERIAAQFGFTPQEMADISPGERRNYHDDITIDILHFTSPSKKAAVVHPSAAAA